MRSMNRREFLHDSALFSAALAAAASMGKADVMADDTPPAPRGANEQLRVAVVGVRGRGTAHVKEFLNKKLNCSITTICDCDSAVVDKMVSQVEKAQGKKPKFEQDIRKVIEDKDIDIVSIATPNHWHALMAVWAMQAGKDVYLEKPVSHNVVEGRRLVDVAAKTKRICESGTQTRSMPGMQKVMQYLQSGKLGKIKVARGLCYKDRKSIGKSSGAHEAPKTCDFDLWCGPAPKSAINRGRFHYDWHWFWDYGNGDIGNQGAHEMEKARWGLGKQELPKSVLSLGGRLGYEDDGETPNTMVSVFDYGDCELIFEVRGLNTKDLLGAKVGNIFYGSEGYLVCTTYDGGVAYSTKGEVLEKFGGVGNHFAHFVNAVRSRKPEDLSCGILNGHLSSSLCHMANISYRLGKPQLYDKAGKAFGDDKEAAETLTRMSDHLKENKVPLDKSMIQVGAKLTMDPKTETFTGDEAKAANALLTREYRKGFELPKV